MSGLQDHPSAPQEFPSCCVNPIGGQVCTLRKVLDARALIRKDAKDIRACAQRRSRSLIEVRGKRQKKSFDEFRERSVVRNVLLGLR